MKLLSVKRNIGVYRKTDDGFEYEIPVGLPVEVLKNIVPIRDGDDELYLVYELSADQLDQLLKIVEAVVKADLNTFSYYLECTGIYD